MAIGWVQVNRHRVVDSRLDAPLGKMCHQPVPHGGVCASDDILVVHMGCPWDQGGQGEFRNSGQETVIGAGNLDSPLVALLQTVQLHAEHGRLQLIQSGVPSWVLTDAVFVPSVLPEGL